MIFKLIYDLLNIQYVHLQVQKYTSCIMNISVENNPSSHCRFQVKKFSFIRSFHKAESNFFFLKNNIENLKRQIIKFKKVYGREREDFWCAESSIKRLRIIRPHNTHSIHSFHHQAFAV